MTKLMKALDLRDAADELKASANAQHELIQRLYDQGLLVNHQVATLRYGADKYKHEASQLILNSVDPT